MTQPLVPMLDVMIIDDGGDTRHDIAGLARDEGFDVTAFRKRRALFQNGEMQTDRGRPPRGSILVNPIVKLPELDLSGFAFDGFNSSSQFGFRVVLTFILDVVALCELVAVR
jgi:hypothetical protein